MAAEAGDDGGCYDSAFVDSSVETAPLSPSERRDAEPRFVAQVTECRANPVVSRRGYLLVAEADEWPVLVKRWVVSRLIFTVITGRFLLTSYFLTYSISEFIDKPLKACSDRRRLTS